MRAPVVMAGDKPPYAVPSMADVEAVPWNGLTVASTFSNCGGSCLGFRMAGWRVAYANEFTEAARRVYALNHPDVHLDPRDVREVPGADVLAAVGVERGELDCLEGSPPCVAFSTAGRRNRQPNHVWGEEQEYMGRRQRTDDLFGEFARLLREVRPRSFVAENVPAMAEGRSRGLYLAALADLRGSGYRVRVRKLDAQWLGVPQRRARLIFVGVREDLGIDPPHPRPLPYRYSLAEACPRVRRLVNRRYRSNMEAKRARFDFKTRLDVALPSPSITAGGVSAVGIHQLHVEDADGEERAFTIDEVKRLCSFPADFQLNGGFTSSWRRLGLAVPPVMMMHVARALMGVLA